MGHEIHRTEDYCRSQRGANQLAKWMMSRVLQRGLPPALPITQRHAERLPGVNTHTSCLCSGQGSRWASRTHQIIGRALPCEAMRQGDGVQRKTHNLSRWIVWWTNSMQTERWRKSTKYRKSFASDKGRANVCASVCLRASWLTS